MCLDFVVEHIVAREVPTDVLAGLEKPQLLSVVTALAAVVHKK